MPALPGKLQQAQPVTAATEATGVATNHLYVKIAWEVGKLQQAKSNVCGHYYCKSAATKRIRILSEFKTDAY
jgi:hypothetical protein